MHVLNPYEVTMSEFAHVNTALRKQDRPHFHLPIDMHESLGLAYLNRRSDLHCNGLQLDFRDAFHVQQQHTKRCIQSQEVNIILLKCSVRRNVYNIII